MAERFTPRPFQKIGTQYLLDHHRCNLWAKPGMGKTSQVLNALSILKMAGSNFFPAIVFAPKLIADVVWSGEIDKWTDFQDISLTKLVGTRGERADALLGKTTDLYVTNYENVETLLTHLGGPKKWPFKIVVADESRRLGGFRLRGGTKRSDALADIARRTGRWANLSGTPSTDGTYADLWGQNWFVDFGERLGPSFTKFEDRWLKVNPYSRKVTLMPGAKEQIQSALADVAIAFRPEDWFSYDEPIVTPKYVTLPRDAQRMSDELEDAYFTQIDDTDIEALNAGVMRGKRLQLASGSIYPTPGADPVHVHDAKVDMLESIVNELGEPLVVAYWWKFTPPRILKKFPKARVFTGQKDMDDWNAGKIDMLLVNYKSGGPGVNLQDGGRAYCNFDMIWDQELRDQVKERLGPARQAQSGYKRTVLGYDIIAKGSEDEAVMIQSEHKCSMSEALIRARARTPT